MQLFGERQRGEPFGKCPRKLVVQPRRLYHALKIIAVLQLPHRLVYKRFLVALGFVHQRIDIPGVRRAHPAFSVVAAGVRFAHCAERAVEADILQIDHACLIGAQPAHLLGQCGVIHFITSLF